MKAIETKNLTKIYGGHLKAVDALNLTIDEGEIYGLAGPNGAGKTTTINMLVTRITPTSGTAIVGGFDITKNSIDVRRLIGVVPQDFTADEDLTGRENMMMVSQFYDVPKAKAQETCNSLLKLVNLEEAADRLVRTYSGGMRKRLELIIGLIHEPKILFLDEPTLGLDVQTRTQMWNYVKEIQSRLNVTIILTSHYLEEIDELAGRVSIIDHGKVLITGTPAELKESLKGDIINLTLSDQKGADLMKTAPDALEVTDSGPNAVRIKVISADESLPKIINFISQHELSTVKLTVQKPTLDEVFLEYTGRSIRDEEGEDTRKMAMNMRRARQ
ncbi:MAG: ATP-binding cassette domain-containing protein [Candidatus Thermoplasmatota archaeon]|jgi:ABC-2 type transport system ATP-binding protein|nr:ATP-binding cassette domain-containing protein [Candidatus Thermoplasmatota archaeon]MCL5441065.1 ATP-binding cassette domain-containing protein [Candidatus Thermoplasmatota archaeon]